MAEHGGGDMDEQDDGGLLEEIKAKLKDPYLMDAKKQKTYFSDLIKSWVVVVASGSSTS
jgi:hypothetical protein